MKKVMTALAFFIISLALAVFLIIILPGAMGFYFGIVLVALTLLCILFPKKKA